MRSLSIALVMAGFCAACTDYDAEMAGKTAGWKAKGAEVATNLCACLDSKTPATAEEVPTIKDGCFEGDVKAADEKNRKELEEKKAYYAPKISDKSKADSLSAAYDEGFAAHQACVDALVARVPPPPPPPPAETPELVCNHTVTLKAVADDARAAELATCVTAMATKQAEIGVDAWVVYAKCVLAAADTATADACAAN